MVTPGSNHFSFATRRALATKGIQIVGLHALPDSEGSCINPVTGYVLDDNGTCRIRLFADVLKLAQPS